MNPGMAVTMFAACFAVLVVAAAAHEGHHPSPSPAPAPNSCSLASPSMVIGVALAFIASLLVLRDRVGNYAL
ncbi:hypothetical protein DKX38_015113 [Salix brachista]|uniref:Uncharacterized protein n=1 Tax=Salix brachista TaxID=2182728 RepID=A0A5N5L4Q5_9ROSI|nr:hypothetical protein DKX38_015113 [Salix brachista]